MSSKHPVDRRTTCLQNICCSFLDKSCVHVISGEHGDIGWTVPLFESGILTTSRFGCTTTFQLDMPLTRLLQRWTYALIDELMKQQRMSSPYDSICSPFPKHAVRSRLLIHARSQQGVATQGGRPDYQVQFQVQSQGNLKSRREEVGD